MRFGCLFEMNEEEASQKAIVDFKEMDDDSSNTHLINKTFERQIPQPPTLGFHCPTCGANIYKDTKYCNNCGQRILWEEDIKYGLVKDAN